MVREKKDALRKATLAYHEQGRPGKIEVIPSKPCVTQRELSLAYTPGVAIPCLEIQKNPRLARRYTAKANLVAVISNGTAVLGLGNIGPLAGKPVMEGKGVLFKNFADIDVFDLELDVTDPDEFIKTVQHLAPTFGGINLEDIKAPECFYIEEELKKRLDIPVFHDDQHGTAIISGAALLNALDLVEKKIEDIRLVVSGAGAAAIACANFYVSLGLKPENILMADSKGILYKGRGDENKNPYKAKFFRETGARTLADAMKGADFFCGLSVKGAINKEMIKTMAERPIIFALANPDPEISYDEAIEARPDAVVATGRSDFPNQVNNVLGFPFIFRGALDTEAQSINEAMKLAAAKALADLARQEVPEVVKRAYNDPSLSYGREYIIPKPFDPRALIWVATGVAEAAIKSGVARNHIDIKAYRESLMEKTDWSREVMRKIYILTRKDPRRIVFPDAHHPKVIWAANEIVREGIAKPVLLTRDEKLLRADFEELKHDTEGIEIIQMDKWIHRDDYMRRYYAMRQRKGITQSRAIKDMNDPMRFGLMMVKVGDVDGLVGGISRNYPEVVRAAMQIIGPKESDGIISGMYLVQDGHKTYFFSDCAVNISPNDKELAAIAIMAARQLKTMHIEPRIAMLSFSNFGSVRVPEVEKITRAVELVRMQMPELAIDGPVQADAALDPQFIRKHFPFADLHKQPNLFIFPDLNASNISLKLLSKMCKVRSIGPIMMGLARPVHFIIRGSSVSNIVNMAAIACRDAQKR
ncbi:MAG TPA: NADP-dependent malic enzyme [Phaeodactylibacter sp.]|nr:NADP-dependent malic enzyme [Phaeodactylibacter sp.]